MGKRRSKYKKSAVTATGETIGLSKTVGRCIYCGKKSFEAVLTEEHVIPYALGGIFTLIDASCDDCQRTINKFETKVLRDTYNSIRIAHAYPSRTRGNKKPITVPIRVKDDAGVEEIKVVPVDDAPEAVIMPKLVQAPRISGAPVSTEDVWVQMLVSHNKDARERIRRVGKDTVTPTSIDIEVFYRFLAKIAHATAVWHIGIDSFDPCLIPGILDNNRNTLYYNVGCALPGDELSAPEDPNARHIKQVRAWRRRNTDTVRLCVVHLRLFTYLPMSPTYEIVAGTLHDDVIL